MSDIILFCKVDNCHKKRHFESSRCAMHRARWKKYKSYDLPIRNDLPNGILKICKIHGELNLNHVRKKINKKISKNGDIKLSTIFSCKICDNKKRYIWESNNKEKVKYYKSKSPIGRHRRKSYGLTCKEYDDLVLKQKNKCAICKKSETKILRNKIVSLSLDHCHKSNKIRGLLCHRCNVFIGYCQESIDILKSAIKYLRHHK